MQRYTVTIVSGGTPGQPPTLVVPFEPSALVTAFIEELFRRIARQGLALAPNTHVATLHLDSETGAIIDCEDVLADVIDPTEKLFAVFSEKHPIATNSTTGQQAAAQQTVMTAPTDGSLSVRVITPALAKSGTASIIQLPLSTTIRQLHTAVAEHLRLPDKTADLDTNECNCNLARKIADGPSPPTQFVIVHGKSAIQRFDLPTASEDALKGVIREHLGQDVESRKKLSLYGAESHTGTASGYKKTPVVAMCSKHRHIPMHAKVADEEDPSSFRSRVIDLHSSEAPIHPASMAATLESAGLSALAADGVLEIYAVHRCTGWPTSVLRAP
ncbi:hypothetical protein LTR36_010904 [Oleoguttula mirabilis]|uniref:Par3/HAL N-terminal domain-containing protein n=1 Tax=Oleoguttula mirabilis TaxID=1507867 RepID=A0AAV9J3H5_9PEZI|nr:hypothetical protein LTR36_010904 [Oleoguttula mirabilis]